MQTLLEYIQNDLTATELEQICEGLELNESLSDLKEKAAEKIKSLKPKYAAAVKNFLEKAKSKGQKTLISALTIISLFAAATPAQAKLQGDSILQFAKDYARFEQFSTENSSDAEKDAFKVDLHAWGDKLDELDEHCYSGYGESTAKDEAKQIAEREALSNYKKQTGKDAENPQFGYLEKSQKITIAGKGTTVNYWCIAVLKVAE